MDEEIISNSDETNGPAVKMLKRKVLMEDGRRYIIYYMFGDVAGNENSKDDHDV